MRGWKGRDGGGGGGGHAVNCKCLYHCSDAEADAEDKQGRLMAVMTSSKGCDDERCVSWTVWTTVRLTEWRHPRPRPVC